jgi:oxygen-independent coproporphyrinogen-3 oxidase
MPNTLEFDAAMLQKYDTYGPRYTSYPTALEFHPGFTAQHYQNALANSNRDGKPLSLYFHIPFCKSLCFYCACSKIITNKQERAIPYMEYLQQEIVKQSQLVDQQREVNQLHLGGGTPTYLSDSQLEELMTFTAQHFNLSPLQQRDFSIEIDPRTVRPTTMAALKTFGFNRISLGVQDFDPKVQEAVNRIQSFAETAAVIEAARASHYKSINIDLIYGLPHQSAKSFQTTLELVSGLRPDRIAVYNYAHMPDKVKSQSLIASNTLPSSVTKLEILEQTINYLQNAGYVYIGMDHFALPEDELALARDNGTLQRNFQGYTTHADSDLIGMGMTSISKIGDCFSQNQREEKNYFEYIDKGHLPVQHGYELNTDDKIRRDLIQSLMCKELINGDELEKRHNIHFETYFAAELEALTPHLEDQLISFSNNTLTVLPLGKLLLRNIAMVFDAYYKSAASRRQFSKAI